MLLNTAANPNSEEGKIPMAQSRAPGDVSTLALSTIMAEYSKMISDLAHLTADLPQRLQLVGTGYSSDHSVMSEGRIGHLNFSEMGGPVVESQEKAVSVARPYISPLAPKVFVRIPDETGDDVPCSEAFLPGPMEKSETTVVAKSVVPGPSGTGTVSVARHDTSSSVPKVFGKIVEETGDDAACSGAWLPEPREKLEAAVVTKPFVRQPSEESAVQADDAEGPPHVSAGGGLDHRIGQILLNSPSIKEDLHDSLSDMQQIMRSCCPCLSPGQTAQTNNVEDVDEVQSRLFTPGIHGDNQKYFEYGAGCVIILNALVTLFQLEYTGNRNAASLGMQDDGSWPFAQTLFDVLEHVFNAIFLLELLIRLVVFKSRVHEDSSLLFDIVVVSVSSVQLYILEPLDSQTPVSKLSVFRMLRFLRVVRILRLVRVLKVFSNLRVLVQTIISSFGALLWSMVFLFLIMIMGGLFLCELLTDYVQNQANNLSTRKWVFRHYGSSTRAIYTLFEVTMSGCWPNYFRTLIHEVNGWFWLFAVTYVSLVIFAIIRIISAIFLKETLQVASNDAEMMIMERAKNKDAYVKKLRRLFEAVDVSGNGTLNQNEFRAIVANPNVKTWLQVLELEVSDTEGLFRLLDDGDGEVTFDEFLKGITRLRGQARTMDVVAIMRKNDKIITELNRMSVGLNELLDIADRPRIQQLYSGRDSCFSSQ